MKIVPISTISFSGMPDNYAKVDKYLSRSAQPQAEDFAWLKGQGVTDVINFRTMVVSALDFDEAELVNSLGMKYHNIPSIASQPSEENITKFLNIVEEISQKGGKTHIHCKAGADRTGMYAFIYKSLKGIGDYTINKAEWLLRGHSWYRYPNLMGWTENFLKKTVK